MARSCEGRFLSSEGMPKPIPIYHVEGRFREGVRVVGVHHIHLSQRCILPMYVREVSLY